MALGISLIQIGFIEMIVEKCVRLLIPIFIVKRVKNAALLDLMTMSVPPVVRQSIQMVWQIKILWYNDLNISSNKLILHYRNVWELHIGE